MYTHNKKIIRWLLTGIFASLFVSAIAHPFSYIYIQGDKSAPFYVKMSGQMLPRYGKTYCIIPELDSGEVHLEILFQQRMFAPQKFTIQVPANGCRGFLLNKQAAGFVLYDLQEKKDIIPDQQ